MNDIDHINKHAKDFMVSFIKKLNYKYYFEDINQISSIHKKYTSNNQYIYSIIFIKFQIVSNNKIMYMVSTGSFKDIDIDINDQNYKILFNRPKLNSIEFYQYF